jgi:hypothetical protein
MKIITHENKHRETISLNEWFKSVCSSINNFKYEMRYEGYAISDIDVIEEIRSYTNYTIGDYSNRIF